MDSGSDLRISRGSFWQGPAERGRNLKRDRPVFSEVEQLLHELFEGVVPELG